jgi:hypothetical protein
LRRLVAQTVKAARLQFAAAGLRGPLIRIPWRQRDDQRSRETTNLIYRRRLMSTHAKPNIVFILCDNTGWGDFSCYGGGTPTPRIDQLARASG